MPTLEVNGTTVVYRDSGPPAGRPDAPTVVFGHGLLFSGWMFHAQVAALCGRYRCVTIDWRGQGDSPPARGGGYGMDELTADAVTLIGHLGVAPVHWVGLSMGGFVGQRIGARHGDLLRSLTLLDTSPDREPHASAVQDIAMAIVYRGLGMRLLTKPVSDIMFGPVFRSRAENRPVIDEFIARLGRCDRAGMQKAIFAVATRAPIYDEIDGIAVPTLVITGADDRPTPAEKGRRIASRIPGARFELVRDCGHSSTLEQPEVVTGLIGDFLTGADGADGAA